MSKAPRLRPGPTWADRCCARRVLASPPLVFRRTQRLCRAASPNMLVKVTLLSLLATVAADSHPVPIDEHIPCYPASTTLNLDILKRACRSSSLQASRSARSALSGCRRRW